MRIILTICNKRKLCKSLHLKYITDFRILQIDIGSLQFQEKCLRKLRSTQTFRDPDTVASHHPPYAASVLMHISQV